jgi:hypothetical protein
MKRVLLVVGAALGLSGCVTTQMNKGLEFMVGQKIDAAVARLGYPDAQRTMLGDTIYIWNTSHNVNLPMTTTSMTTGYAGSTPVYGSTISTQYVRANFNCTIQLGTTTDGVIKSWQWQGNMGGCATYARMLRASGRR